MNQYIQEIIKNLQNLDYMLSTYETRISQLEKYQINNDRIKEEMIELLKRSMSNG